ncbi:protein CHUP1, chloroplastic [Gossypium hirsutum]|uniref:Protein CHUP1, chloroplastic n=1 Tax=Gossypium hirsutum TaxID=3635 RepID=A0A1U8LVK4_GOSHI|nr:protein CHUP1, chloroplastic-like [Gossypium hirsutum]
MQRSPTKQKTMTNQSKSKSSWGSSMVQGFKADKKPKAHIVTLQTKKLPLSNSDAANAKQKNPSLVSHSRAVEMSKEVKSTRNLEIEAVELRRLNKELQLEKRSLALKVSSLETQLASLVKANQRDVAKLKAEASMLRHTNENLGKQIEGLQMRRLNEVEELAYLRWVNSCLRDELRNSSSENNGIKRLNLIKKIKKWSFSSHDSSTIDHAANHVEKDWKGQSNGIMCRKEMGKDGTIQRLKFLGNCDETNEKRASRIPNTPPKPSSSVSNGPKEGGCIQIPPPPPPPPPSRKFSVRSGIGSVQPAPQVVEFYHSLMKRVSRKDSHNGGTHDVPDVANVHSNMIGEIQNRSSHLLAIKADVETQGEFVNSLIKEVNNAVYHNIEDVVAFVKWLDDELSYLVDERAVLKHFEWPEKKSDTLREAAFEYGDLKKLEYEILYHKDGDDDSTMPCDIALIKMATLFEKIQRTVYSIVRTRDSLMHSCKEFHIPTDWMLDNGITSKIKQGTVKLGKRYMKRVAMEVQLKATMEKDDPSMDYMLLQGVKFAFRIHQFAGGFDDETMHAFVELKNLVDLLSNNQTKK